ncbi:MAG: hypothetical protein R3A10_01105 [Caldilineaceae bacterium]
MTALTYGLLPLASALGDDGDGAGGAGAAGRAPALVTLLIAAVVGGIVYPLAGNWVQGGGWLECIGTQSESGPRLRGFRRRGTVFLVAAGFLLAACGPAPARDRTFATTLQPGTAPLLAVVGALVKLAGGAGSALVQSAASERAHRCGSCCAQPQRGAQRGGRLAHPAGLHLVCASGTSHPTLRASGRGLIAGMALGPFVQPGTAFLTGILAGLTVPFVTYIVDTSAWVMTPPAS